MIHRISDFLTRVRVPVQIEDEESYRLVTIRMRHQGVCLRGQKAGSEIGTKTMYRVKAGQFILSGIDARNGAFGVVPAELEGAVVTNDFWYFDINDRIIDRDYFLYLTSTPFFDNLCRLASDGTTNRVRLQADKFYNYEISLPSVEEQRVALKRLVALKSKTTALTTELDKQDDLLKKLQQALLQDAVQGRLTAQWRTQTAPTETGPALLARICAEKTDLVLQGKLRKEKPLPTITEDEKPFELPEGWVWCYIEELCYSITDCVNRTAPVVEAKTPFKMLRTTNIRNGRIDFENVRHVSEETYTIWTRRGKPEIGDIILTREAPLGEVGIVDSEENVFLGQRLVQYRPNPMLLESKFLLYLFRTSIMQDQFKKLTAGAFVGHLRVPDSKILLIPIPPLTEQQAIVEAVERALGQVAGLRAELEAQRVGAGELLRALLHRAFAGGEGVEEITDARTEELV